MNASSRLRDELDAAMTGAGSPLAMADQLCRACVDLLEVDGASISMTHEGTTRGTFGSSGELSRHLDELQFTFGEGPCLDAVLHGSAILVPDLADPDEQRWPAFRGAVLESGVSAVFALPVSISSSRVGALDLYNHRSGHLDEESLAGGMMAAELASLALLDLLTSEVDWAAAAQTGDGWGQLASLQRVEVYQATGMIMGALNVGPAEALVRLRAHAFTKGTTASEVAWAVIDRRLVLDADEGWRDVDGGGRSG